VAEPYTVQPSNNCHWNRTEPDTGYSHLLACS